MIVQLAVHLTCARLLAAMSADCRFELSRLLRSLFFIVGIALDSFLVSASVSFNDFRSDSSHTVSSRFMGTPIRRSGRPGLKSRSGTDCVRLSWCEKWKPDSTSGTGDAPRGWACLSHKDTRYAFGFLVLMPSTTPRRGSGCSSVVR